jgi:hypothetical protein
MGNPNWMFTDPETGELMPAVPVEIRLYNVPIASEDGGAADCFVLGSCWYPDNAENRKARAAGLFVQDVVTINNRLTITGGLRWDHQYGWNPAQNRLDSPWCGNTAGLNSPELYCGGSFEEQDRPFTWSDLTPRVSAIYDIMGDGRWAAKASYSRYAESLGTRFVGALNVNSPGREDWDWFDPNGDGLFQFGEQLQCGEADPADCFRNDNFPGVTTGIDPDLYAPMTNEFTVGLEHEIIDNVLVSVTGIFRGRNDDTGNVNIGRPFGPMITNEKCIAECTPTFSDGSPRPLEDPWVPVETVDPGADGIIGTGDDGGPITVWALDPDTFSTNLNLTTNVNQWGFDDYTDYKGVSFVVSKRWSDNWQLLASYDYGRGYVQGVGTSPNGLFNARREELFGSRPHNFKVTGNYLIAEPIGVNLGLFVRAQSGEPVRATYTYDDSVIEPPNGPFERQSNTGINIDNRGEGNNGRPSREDFVTIFDFRAEKQVTIGRYGVVHFYFDVFNMFNSNTTTEFRWGLGPRYQEIQDILPPRVIRIGGAWDF